MYITANASRAAPPELRGGRERTVDSLKFGTSGLRGLVTQLTPDVCRAYVGAFLAHMADAGMTASGAALVGRDLRGSSPSIAAACLEAVAAAGIEAVDCGALPTPALALETMRRGVPAIMVTGSHIPEDRNGLKFYRPDGEITKVDEVAITARLRQPPAGRGRIAPPAADAGAARRYVERYRSQPGFALTGMTVGVYQHSTVARDLLVELIEALGATVVPLARSPVFVPVDTEALRPEDIALARDWATSHRLDAIVTADGDADRPLIADERGIFLRGDAVGVLTAAALAADTVVTPVTSTSAVELSGLFGTVVRTRVGSPYVIEGMAGAGGVVVGFEANGGVLLGSPVRRDGLDLDPLPTRDAVLPILAVLSMARARGLSLSALGATLPQRYTASDRLKDYPAEVAAAFLARLADDTSIAAFLGGRVELVGVDRTDGVRLLLAGGDTLHYRASGNAPELRCYAESATQAQAEAWLAWGLDEADRNRRAMQRD